MMDKWDRRFFEMAYLVAGWSKDPSTKCGAVIVRPDRTIVSVGYNGFPRGCDDDKALYANRDEKYQRVVHAEVNAILSAREPLHGYTLYSVPGSTSPTCDRCATVVIQSGIAVVKHEYVKSDLACRWAKFAERANELLHQAGVTVARCSPLS